MEKRGPQGLSKGVAKETGGEYPYIMIIQNGK